MKAKGLKFKILKTICLVMLVVLSTSCFSLLGTTIYGSLKGMQNPPAEVETETPETPSVTKASTATYKVTAEEKRIISELTLNSFATMEMKADNSEIFPDISNYVISGEVNFSYEVPFSSGLNVSAANYQSSNLQSTEELVTNEESFRTEKTQTKEQVNEETKITKTSSVVPMTSEQASKSTASYILDNHVVKAKTAPEQFIETFAETYANNDVFYINKASGIISFLTALNNGYTFEGKTVSRLCSIDFDGAEFNYMNFKGNMQANGTTISNTRSTSFEPVYGYMNAAVGGYDSNQDWWDAEWTYEYCNNQTEFLKYAFWNSTGGKVSITFADGTYEMSLPNYSSYLRTLQLQPNKFWHHVEFSDSISQQVCEYDEHVKNRSVEYVWSRNQVVTYPTSEQIPGMVAHGDVIKDQDGKYYVYCGNNHCWKSNITIYQGGAISNFDWDPIIEYDGNGQAYISDISVSATITDAKNKTFYACPDNLTFNYDDITLNVSGLCLGGVPSYYSGSYFEISNCCVEGLNVNITGDTDYVNVAGLVVYPTKIKHCLVQYSNIGACAGFYRFGPINSADAYYGTYYYENCGFQYNKGKAPSGNHREKVEWLFTYEEKGLVFTENTSDYSTLGSCNSNKLTFNGDGNLESYWYLDTSTDIKFNGGKPYLRYLIDWYGITYRINNDSDTAYDTETNVVIAAQTDSTLTAINNNDLHNDYIDKMSKTTSEGGYKDKNSFTIYGQSVNSTLLAGYLFEWERYKISDSDVWTKTTDFNTYYNIGYTVKFTPESYYLDFNRSMTPTGSSISDTSGTTTDGKVLVDYGATITVTINATNTKLTIAINNPVSADATVTITVANTHYILPDNMNLTITDKDASSTVYNLVTNGTGTVPNLTKCTQANTASEATYAVTIQIVLKEYGVGTGEAEES